MHLQEKWQMATAEQLAEYFTGDLGPCAHTVGAEIETLFVDGPDGRGSLMTFRQSQRLFTGLIDRGWSAKAKASCESIIELVDGEGNTCKYDAGHANIELATAPGTPDRVLGTCRRLLGELYDAASDVGASPYRAPIARCEEDTLVALTDRERSYIALDGREAYRHIARIASFQLTFAVPAQSAIERLNRLNEHIASFRQYFPQDAVWRDYVRRSRAGYRHDRFGGPTRFDSLEHYCDELTSHDVILVAEQKLVPFCEVEDLDIPLFLRSVWWYFRLRRYGDQLCIEVRPNGRYDDEHMAERFRSVCDIIGHPQHALH